MHSTPTLQSLAMYARDHFGEDGYPFEESIPSSFDVVVAACADQPGMDDVWVHAGAMLHRSLQSRGRIVAQDKVDEFVRIVVAYLTAVHPEAEAVQQEREQLLLSHLFWGHLVAARFAAGGPDHRAMAGTSSQWRSREPVLV